MLFLLNLVLAVAILCLLAWGVIAIARAAGAPPVVYTIVWVVALVIILIWLLNLVAWPRGGGVVFVRDW